MNKVDAAKRRWTGDKNALQSGAAAMTTALDAVAQPLFVVEADGMTAFSHQGGLQWGASVDPEGAGLPLLGFVPPLTPSQLGGVVLERVASPSSPTFVSKLWFQASSLHQTPIGDLRRSNAAAPCPRNSSVPSLVHSKSTWLSLSS